MRTKKCTGPCGLDKSVSEFYERQKGSGKYQSRCIPCRRLYTRKLLHGEQRLKHSSRTHQQRLSKTEFLRARKDVPCMDCGFKFPHFVMDFDHVRGEKVMCVGRMAISAFTMEKIEMEIAKCDVVCSNCHRIRTHMCSQNTSHPKNMRRSGKSYNSSVLNELCEA